MAIALIVWTAAVSFLAYTTGHIEGETKITEEYLQSIIRQLDTERRT